MKSALTRGLVCGLLLAGLVGSASPLSAAVSLELRPAFQVVNPGDYADLELYAVSDSGDVTISAADVLITWDPTYLDLVGLDISGASGVMSAYFPPVGPWSEYNDGQAPPTDGTAYFRVDALLGQPLTVTPAGTLLTTILIDALAPTVPGSTIFSIATTLGGDTESRVFDGVTPALKVTGSLGSAEIVILPEPATLSLLGLGLVVLRRRRVIG